ncbi:MAG: hypothetical protein Tsb0032_05460 [Kiloniellaceae bacterium]
MVALAVDPAGQADPLPGMGRAQFTAGMGTVGVHWKKLPENEVWRAWNLRARGRESGLLSSLEDCPRSRPQACPQARPQPAGRSSRRRLSGRLRAFASVQ